MRTCKTVSIKPYINGEDNIKSSNFIYTVIVVTRTTNLLAVVTTPYICQLVSPCILVQVIIKTLHKNITYPPHIPTRSIAVVNDDENTWHNAASFSYGSAGMYKYSFCPSLE